MVEKETIYREGYRIRSLFLCQTKAAILKKTSLCNISIHTPVSLSNSISEMFRT